ncbi:hypothetical protein K504DRAFT_460299 [Pleomassaria siparia CBS 279.74]|uniref:Uncharacterized protein n=1 Tax=Pleomassaria siparia CBS 279.74 TaxID=1314801 RepID=A0A6G1JY95_9PLEO|nr:hypothetical protein K504DRAFT_460299 [Pleomassaria siparia CBS 279.74]
MLPRTPVNTTNTLADNGIDPFDVPMPARDGMEAISERELAMKTPRNTQRVRDLLGGIGARPIRTQKPRFPPAKAKSPASLQVNPTILSASPSTPGLSTSIAADTSACIAHEQEAASSVHGKRVRGTAGTPSSTATPTKKRKLKRKSARFTRPPRGSSVRTPSVEKIGSENDSEEHDKLEESDKTQAEPALIPPSSPIIVPRSQGQMNSDAITVATQKTLLVAIPMAHAQAALTSLDQITGGECKEVGTVDSSHLPELGGLTRGMKRSGRWT